MAKLTQRQKEIRDLKKKYVAALNAVEGVDKDMIKESIVNYIKDSVDYQDKVCLDLGTNIGSFVKIALDHGAKFVYGVECDPRNYAIASRNFESELRANIVFAAASGLEEETLKIYKSNSKSNHSSTSILKRRGTFTEYDEVKNFHIKTLLNETQPDIVKIDIEGAEYSIIDDVIEYRPDVLFIELHGNHDLTQETIQKLNEAYNHNEIEEITIIQSVGGYDCLFYK